MQISNFNAGGGSQTNVPNKKTLIKDAPSDLKIADANQNKNTSTPAVETKETIKTPEQTALDLKTYNDLLIFNANVQKENIKTEYNKQTGESYGAANGTKTMDEKYNYVNNNASGNSPVAQVYSLVTVATYTNDANKNSTHIGNAYGQLAITGNDVPIANTLIAFLSNNNPDATLQIGNATPEQIAKNFFQAADNIKTAAAPGTEIKGNQVLATDTNNKNETKFLDDSFLNGIKTDGTLSTDELYATKVAYVVDAEVHTAAAKINQVAGDSDNRTTSASTVNVNQDDPYDSFFEQVAKMPGKPGITEEKLAAAIKLVSDSNKTSNGLSFTKDKLNTFLYTPENLAGGPKTSVKIETATPGVIAAKANAEATAAKADAATKTAASTKADAAAKAAEAAAKAATEKATAATKAAAAAAAALARDKGPGVKVYLPASSTYIIRYQAVDKAASTAKDAAAATAAATTATAAATAATTAAKAAKEAATKATANVTATAKVAATTKADAAAKAAEAAKADAAAAAKALAASNAAADPRAKTFALVDAMNASDFAADKAMLADKAATAAKADATAKAATAAKEVAAAAKADAIAKAIAASPSGKGVGVKTLIPGTTMSTITYPAVEKAKADAKAAAAKATAARVIATTAADVAAKAVAAAAAAKSDAEVAKAKITPVDYITKDYTIKGDAGEYNISTRDTKNGLVTYISKRDSSGSFSDPILFTGFEKDGKTVSATKSDFVRDISDQTLFNTLKSTLAAAQEQKTAMAKTKAEAGAAAAMRDADSLAENVFNAADEEFDKDRYGSAGSDSTGNNDNSNTVPKDSTQGRREKYVEEHNGVGRKNDGTDSGINVLNPRHF